MRWNPFKKKRKLKNHAMHEDDYNELIRQIEREANKKFIVRPKRNPRHMRSKGDWKSIYDPNAPRFAYAQMEFHTGGIKRGLPKRADIYYDQKIAKENPKLEKKIVRHELREILRAQYGMPIYKAHQVAVRGERECYGNKRTRLGHDLRKVYLSLRGKRTQTKPKKSKNIKPKAKRRSKNAKR